MKSIIRITGCALLSLASIALVQAQTSPAPAATTKAASADKTPARTDMYHVHFVKAALGKGAALADALKTQDPKDPMPGHFMILRHQCGDSWDYAVITHLGTKAVTEAAATGPTPARDLQDWHNDTLVNGPPWADFVREMGLGDNASKTAGSAYNLSVYRAAPGQRDQLEKFLCEPPVRPSDTSVGNVLMQHREGSAWTFLSIARYNNWQDFGTNEGNTIAQSAKGQGGWFKLRDYISFHTDTASTRISP
jgi:hypothetical protein